jgi:hypothetical protein
MSRYKCPFCGHEKEISFSDIQVTDQPTGKLTLQDIVDYVSDVTDVSHEEMLAPTKRRVIVRARQYAYFFAYNCTDISLTDIGMHISGGDHSSVLHGKNLITNFITIPYKDILHDIELIRYKMLVAGFDIPKLEFMMDRYKRTPAFKYLKEKVA